MVQQLEHKTKPFMPPKKAKDKLAPEEITLIRHWIDQGAPNAAPGEVLTSATALVVVPRIEPKGIPRKPVRAIVWSPQAKLAAIAKDGQIELLTIDERAVVRHLKVDKGNINALAISTDGMTLAAGAGESGAGGEIDLWNIADGTRIRHLEGHTDAVYSIALSADGKILASGSYDNKIILWDLASSKPIRTLDGHNGAVLGLAFRPDGQVLASASGDRTVKLWDVKSGARLDTFAESLKELTSIRFSPDGQRVFAAGYDNRIRAWQITPTAKEGTNHLLVAQFAHQGAILALALSSDGKRLASSADDRLVKIWDSVPTSASGAPELKMLQALPAQSDWPAALAFANDDKMLLVGRLDGTVRFYNSKTGIEILPPKPELTAIAPRGIQAGKTTTLSLTGQHLAGVKRVLFSDPKLEARILPGGKSIEVTCPADLMPGAYDLKVRTAGGESLPVKVYVDDLPQAMEKEPNDSPTVATEIKLPTDVWGGFERRGDSDNFAFEGNSGQTVLFDVAAKRLGSVAKVLAELLGPDGKLLASSSGFDGSPEPVLQYKLPADGKYILRLSELEAQASPMHFYRVSAGSFALVTGFYPLAVAPNCDSKVKLLGVNLPADAWGTVKAAASGEADIALDRTKFRMRQPMKAVIGSGPELTEIEPNDTPDHATPIVVPASINGRIDRPGDADLFRFDAKAGQTYILETLASRRGSPVDTRIEVLHPDGSPVQRVQLRAVRDSAINFRGFDANGLGGRLDNWKEMDLNQYLYMSGEVVRLFQAPRGPDAEYGFYTIGKKRQCYFDTTATAHALDEPCYIVEPHKPGETLEPNGLPVFTINYMNDDDADRKLGSDSKLSFTAPADGPYLVRVTDARDGGGERYVYRLTVRPAVPDFNVTFDAMNPVVPRGAGKSFTVTLDRIDGYEGTARVDIAGAPPGLLISTPLVVEAGHTVATGTIYAATDAPMPTTANQSQIKATVTAMLNGREVTKPIDGFGQISLGKKSMLNLGIDPIDAPTTRPVTDLSQVPQITVAPSEFTPARLWIHRNGAKTDVTFEADNLPHGVIIADIGLSGVLIAPEQSERRIFLHTAPWVEDQDRLCYIRAKQAGAATSMPVMIHVRHHASPVASK
jgi:WD40 repeat protein